MATRRGKGRGEGDDRDDNETRMSSVTRRDS